MREIFVIKYNGQQQLYDRRKVLNSILHSGVEKNKVLEILKKVEDKLYNNISTKELYQIVFSEIENYGLKQHSRTYRLREALSRLDSADFEKFVKAFLEKEGFSCIWDRKIQGFCIDHQIDIIAEKNNQTFFVEVKKHKNFHRDSGLGTVAELWARLEDLQKGFKTGKSKINIANAWLITNTKFSDYAKKYSDCKGLKLLGWRYNSFAENKTEGLEKMIENLGVGMITEIVKNLR